MIELQKRRGVTFFSLLPKGSVPKTKRVQCFCISSLYSGFTHPRSIPDYSSACGDDEECTRV